MRRISLYPRVKRDVFPYLLREKAKKHLNREDHVLPRNPIVEYDEIYLDLTCRYTLYHILYELRFVYYLLIFI